MKLAVEIAVQNIMGLAKVIGFFKLTSPSEEFESHRPCKAEHSSPAVHSNYPLYPCHL
jgi:hypothetical protein